MGDAPKIRSVGLIGDVHTEADVLARALERLRALRPEVILCTGDIVDGPFDSRAVERCCELLRRNEVITICGNHDRWMLDETMRDLPGATDHFELDDDALAFLRGLPATVELDTAAGRLLLCHGMGDDDMASLRPHDHWAALQQNGPLQAVLESKRYAFVVAGHVHIRMHREISGTTFVNAGTLLSRQFPCCAVLDVEKNETEFFDL